MGRKISTYYMKHLLPFFIFSFSLFTASGQNLVPNPSFEEYSECPNNPGQIDRAQNWYAPTTGSSDYFNSCFTTGGVNMGVPSNRLGYQEPSTGEAYAGLILFESAGTLVYREYLQCQLVQPLVLGQSYYFSVNVALADSAIYTMRDFGVHFSSDSVLSNNFQNLQVIPQITYSGGTYFDNNWLTISGEYMAFGNEQFMTLGYFEDNTSLDTVSTGNSMDFTSNDVCYVYIDDACLSRTYDDCDKLNNINVRFGNSINAYPNPATNHVKVDLPFNTILEAQLLGNVLSKPLPLRFSQIERTVHCSIPAVPNGVYQLRIITDQQTFNHKLLILQ